MNEQKLDSKIDYYKIWLDNQINYYQIWLIGDRCDGWEKAGVQKELKKLMEIKKKLENNQ